MGGCEWQNKTFSVPTTVRGKRVCGSCQKESNVYILGLCLECYHKGEQGSLEGKSKYKLDFKDNPNGTEIIKIGKEIKRFKQLDGVNNKEIEKRFGRDANKLMERKQDNSLIKSMTTEIVRGLRTINR